MADDDLKRVSREEAIALCLKFYLPLEPCVRGHVSKRRTNNNQCAECLRIHKAKFRSENRARLNEERSAWARANRGRINAYKRKYWSKKSRAWIALLPPEVRDCIVPLSVARASGLKYYFTGKACKNGHLVSRKTSTRACSECSKLQCKKWYRKNIDYAKVRHSLWREKSKEQRQKYARAYREKARGKERARYARNPQKHINKVKAYYQANKERIKAERKKEYYERQQNDPVYRANAAKKAREWSEHNPDRARRNARVANHRRRALECAASGSFTADDIRAILKAQGHRCAYCKKNIKEDSVMDHIVPLARGGSNDRKNMQATCAPCNARKSAKDPLDFARSLGMLL